MHPIYDWLVAHTKYVGTILGWLFLWNMLLRGPEKRAGGSRGVRVEDPTIKYAWVPGHTPRAYRSTKGSKP